MTSIADDFIVGDDQLEIGSLSIPTSYGRIAAKTWKHYDENRLKVLAVHGWQDNAGTFDQLLPLLPLDSMYVVAIDLPGHGSSSHLPKGIPYTDMTWVIAIKTVLDYLKWDSNVTIIAHSMGANASLELAALYPEIVERLVMIDTIKPRIIEPNEFVQQLGDNISQFIRSQNISQLYSRPNLSFSVKKAIDVIIQTHLNGKITQQGALCLLKRAVEFDNNNPDQVIFKRDSRLNFIIRRTFDKQQLLSYLNGIRCRLMIIRARQTHSSLKGPYEEEFLDLYRLKCDSFEYHEVDGDHYVHLTKPENISFLITTFLFRKPYLN